MVNKILIGLAVFFGLGFIGLALDSSEPVDTKPTETVAQENAGDEEVEAATPTPKPTQASINEEFRDEFAKEFASDGEFTVADGRCVYTHMAENYGETAIIEVALRPTEADMLEGLLEIGFVKATLDCDIY